MRPSGLCRRDMSSRGMAKSRVSGWWPRDRDVFPSSSTRMARDTGWPSLGRNSLLWQCSSQPEQEEEQLHQTEAEEESCSLEQSEVASSGIVANTLRTTPDI